MGCNGNVDVIIPFDEKIYWTGTIDEDFDGSTVMIIIDKNFSGINKVHEKSFFGDIEILSINDLTIITANFDSIDLDTFRQILALYLPGDSKENVVNAIHHLERINGIMYAGPNYIAYPPTVFW